MPAKNFVNFHVLISHSPSCLNRDDMNMQKTAVFGGVNRVRISSQSLKRTMRTSDYYVSHLGTASTRTRDLEKLIPIFTEALKDEFDPALIAKTMELFVRAKASGDETDEADGQDEGARGDADAPKKLAVAPWSLDEIRVLCGIIESVELDAEEREAVQGKVRTEQQLVDEAQSKKKKKGVNEELSEKEIKSIKAKAAKQQSVQPLMDEALLAKQIKAAKASVDAIRRALMSSVDIALSGRMATSGLMTTVDGAMAIAHAITTHAVEPQDVDWFTAVDDLTVDAGETGAGHLSTQQFSSGVFYRYASLNLKQLQVNLGLLPGMKSTETADSRQKALDIAHHVFHMLATLVPSAKQQSFAAHNLADFAIASFADQPISLANAFEEPIKRDRNGGFLKPSVAALAAYWTRINTAYGLDENARAFSVQPGVELNGPAAASLAALETWITKDGQG